MNLTDVAAFTKRGLLYGAIFVVALVVAMYIWDRGSKELARRNPPPAPAPTVLFGQLPMPVFTMDHTPLQTASGSATPQFVLDTIQATPPTFPPSISVLTTKVGKPRLSDRETAASKAQSWGFESEPTQISDTNYVFTDNRSPRRLELVRGTEELTLTYLVNLDPSLLFGGTLPSSQEAITIVKNILKQHGFLTTDLEQGKTVTQYVSYNDGQFVPAIAQAQANAVRVDLWRANLSDLPVVDSRPERANISAIISSNRDNSKQLLFLHYAYWPIKDLSSATYPIKDAKTAFNQLSQGLATVVRAGSPVQQIVISNMYLAYYNPPYAPQYFEPIVVFEGRNDFVAYLSAITDEWLIAIPSPMPMISATPPATPTGATQKPNSPTPSLPKRDLGSPTKTQ